MTADPWADLLEGRARQNKAYAGQKLTFFDNYLSPAFEATQRKVTRHYLDLFAGSGVWEDETKRRHLGSPLKALSISATAEHGGFTEAYLVNLDPADHEALARRIDLMVVRGLTDLPRNQIHLVNADASDAIPDILDGIHRLSWIFTYADIENPRQWPWTNVTALHSRGHKSLELYLLFPLQMAIRRLLGYTTSWPEAVTRFYGCEDWRPIADRRRTSSRPQQLRFLGDMEHLYAERLRTAGWKYVRRQRRVADRGRRTLYHMLFATNHPAGKALSDWEAVDGGDDRYRDQGVLGL